MVENVVPVAMDSGTEHIRPHNVAIDESFWDRRPDHADTFSLLSPVIASQ
jgi:hypothetical protein